MTISLTDLGELEYAAQVLFHPMCVADRQGPAQRRANDIVLRLLEEPHLLLGLVGQARRAEHFDYAEGLAKKAMGLPDDYRVGLDDVNLHRARVEALEARVREFEAVATYRIAHIYRGECPDSTTPDERDPECPACRILGGTHE